MSVMEKIFGLMGRTANPPAPPASNNPAQNPPIQGQASPNTEPNGVLPQNSATPPSPLSKFEKLWEPTPVDPNAPTPAPGIKDVDPGKIMEAAGKVDFAQILSREDLQKVAAGGEEAVAALTTLLNKTAQTVYGQSAFAASKIVEKALAEAEGKFTEKIPALLQQRGAQELLLQQNKQLSHPAVAPIVEMMREQLVQKYPNATSQQIAEMAQEMMKGAATVFAPTPSEDPSKKSSKPKDEDWDLYIGN